jgi:hypothetical protein
MNTALFLAGIALGCRALIMACPQRAGLFPPTLPLALGFGGMLVGLLFDLTKTDPNSLNPVCTILEHSGLVQVLSLHFKTMPGMHIGMLVGGLFAVSDVGRDRPWDPRRLLFACGQYVLCSACMLVGMTLGAVWFKRSWHMGADAWPDILGAMCFGMTWGMVASVGLCRALTTWHRAANRYD